MIVASPSSTEATASLPDRIHLRLRSGIISGTYAQGSRLPEARLSRELDVSRVPLREALPRLEMEGLVTSSPGRGAVVRTWTLRDVEELFDARIAIEVAAAGTAARRIGEGAAPHDLTRALVSSQTALVGHDDLQIAATSVALHDAVVAASENTIMVSTMRAISGRMLWLFHLTAGRDQHRACAEHEDLVSAIVSGDVAGGRSLMTEHVESGRGPTLTALAALL